MGSHAGFLQSAGAEKNVVDAVASNKVGTDTFSNKDRALLDYVEVLTRDPAKVRDNHVQRMRAVGWKDEEIFEATFDTALFAFFNRMADAYGLDYPADGWLPNKQ